MYFLALVGPRSFRPAVLTCLLTTCFSGVHLSPAKPIAKTEFTLAAVSNPQPGQEWALNQEIQIAGHSLKLVSISAVSSS
jgi:hypothetical protein